ARERRDVAAPHVVDQLADTLLVADRVEDDPCLVGGVSGSGTWPRLPERKAGVAVNASDAARETGHPENVSRPHLADPTRVHAGNGCATGRDGHRARRVMARIPHAGSPSGVSSGGARTAISA